MRCLCYIAFDYQSAIISDIAVLLLTGSPLLMPMPRDEGYAGLERHYYATLER